MERWETIKEHPNYEISNLGEVRNTRTERVLTPVLNGGYERVNLDGRLYYVHKLVAEAFRGDFYGDAKVRHIDGDVRNNEISNLRFTTRDGQTKNNNDKVSVVRCRECSRRGQYDVCEDKDDDFYCSYGRR